MAGRAERLEIGPVEPPVWSLPDGDDVIDNGCLGTAATAGGIGREIVGSGLFPLPVIATGAGVRPLGVCPSLALGIACHSLGAALTSLMNATTVTAYTRSRAGHDQATGRSDALPRMNMAPTVTEVPLFRVSTALRYRLKPR